MILGNFDADGRLVRLHLDPAKNECHSEQDKMLDQRKMSWRETFRLVFDELAGCLPLDSQERKEVDAWLCLNCFPEDEE